MRPRVRASTSVQFIEGLEPCVYCGVPANSVDHIPPISVRAALVDTGVAHRYPFIEVWACRECNCLLGARSLWTVPDRKRYVKRALARRYAAVLRIPEWTDSELARMGTMMREHILNGIRLRDYIRARISF